MKVGAANFSLEPIREPEEFWNRVEKILNENKNEGCDFLVLPEYFAVSYALALEPKGGFSKRLRNFTKHVPEFLKHMQQLSDKHRTLIVAGSIPVLMNKKLVNRCYIFRPKTAVIFQDKIHMTRFEDEEWSVSAGPAAIRTFKWHDAICAVAICYDIEFPRVSEALTQAKVDVVCVPSCTDTEHGYWRVRHCASARAIEGQHFSVMSSIVSGDRSYSEIDTHFGQSVILSPCDGTFPPSGLLAISHPQRESVIVQTLNLKELHRIRRNGAVLNLRDSKQQRKIKIKN